MYRLAARQSLTWWQGALVALSATCCAWLIRAAFSSVLSGHALYPTFMGAVMITALVSGWRNAALTAVLGAILANTFVDEVGWGVFVGVSIYFVVAGYTIYLIHGLTSSLRRETKLRVSLDAVSHEYQHRIQNLLAVSEAVVQQTGRSASSVGEFEDKVLARLKALSRAQDLLLDQGVATVPLHSTLSRSLLPFDIEARLVGPLSGPEVSLASDTAVALALVVNELATNATKYGAMSSPDGRLQLRWSVRSNCAEVDWKELGGPPVTPPAQRGFGSRLVERILPQGSGADISFEEDGVRCKIKLELAALAGPGELHPVERQATNR